MDVRNDKSFLLWQFFHSYANFVNKFSFVLSTSMVAMQTTYSVWAHFILFLALGVGELKLPLLHINVKAIEAMAMRLGLVGCIQPDKTYNVFSYLECIENLRQKKNGN